MSVEPSVKSEATFFSTGSNALHVLSTRIKSRIAFRRLHFAPKGNHNASHASDDESLDEGRSSDSESSPEATSKPTVTPGYRRATSNLYYWNSPRIELLDLPLEIIEHIAMSLRDQRPPLDAAALYISEKYSDFSEARFSLSALSQVCSSVRHATERILYRNIQLDFTGWKGRKHTGWPAGSLRLLLRTLQQRPELGRYIYIAALDFQLSSTDSEVSEKALEEFLLRAPNLTHLFLSQCPVALWDFSATRLAGFATTFAPGILPSLLEGLPALRDLHLRDCHVMALAGTLPSHRLRHIRLDSSHENASAHFARVLTICGNSVEALDVRFIGGLQLPAPLFFGESQPRKGGDAIRTLRLDNLSVLSHLSSGYAHLLHDLPMLQHLHVSHHASFASGAFSVLPASLLSLTVSAYYGLWTPEPAKKGFMASLARCISISTLEIAGVEAASEDAEEMEPVVAACKTEKILFKEVKGSRPFVTVFFGTRIACKVEEGNDEPGNESDEL
ncbi:hypothetical protein B0H15DRAFT_834512 [Mycena belliarum]|uniref:Uncharacterized protein n=1 Tax=Mycena belliarum TaxID=1033014 RepID=A0AAD6XNP9_9AGAR|nr:hypothetical protein B0H15DRAFT_834512 [Mycena belliae]